MNTKAGIELVVYLIDFYVYIYIYAVLYLLNHYFRYDFRACEDVASCSTFNSGTKHWKSVLSLIWLKKNSSVYLWNTIITAHITMDSLTRTLLILVVIFLGGIVQKVRVDVPLSSPQSNYTCPVQDRRNARCAHLNLTSVPQDLPNDLLVLSIDHNQLTELVNRSFMNYNQLDTLNAGHNFIAFIDGGTFETLPQLQVVRLDYNLITFLPIYYLQKNTLLYIINLSNNKISNISTQKCEKCYGWRNMSAVDLSFNKLTTINKDDFLPWRNCSVHKFNVKDNNVTFIQPKAFERICPKSVF